MKFLLPVLFIFFISFLQAQPTYNFATAINSSTTGVSSNATATDAKGNIYVCGFMNGTVDFDPVGTFNVTATGGANAYVAKYNSSGVFQWAFNIPNTGTAGSILQKIITDQNGYIYIYGILYTGTHDMDPSTNTNNIVSTTSNLNVCAKYDGNKTPTSTSFYQWSFSCGISSASSFQNYNMAVDNDNSFYLIGEFTSDGTTDFDPSANTTFLPASASKNCMFIAKYDGTKLPTDVNFFKWARCNTFSTTGATIEGRCGARNIGIDALGNIYVSGSYYAFNVCGNITSCDFSGTGAAGATGYTMTATTSVPCPTTSYSLTYDGFVVKYNSNGVFQSVLTLGGVNDDGIQGIAVEPSGGFYITGYFGGNNTSTTNTVDFDPGVGTANLTSTNGLAPMFIAKYSSTGAYQWAKTLGTNTLRYPATPRDMIRDPANNIYITGDLTDTNIDFNPDAAGANNLSTAGGADIFVAKYNNTGNYQWAFKAGGTLADNAKGIAIDLSGNPIISGYFRSTGVDFDPGAGTNNLSAVGTSNNTYLASYKQCDVGFDKWNGTTNNAWATAANWCYNAIPTSSQIAVIQSGSSNNPVQLTTSQSALELVLLQNTSLNIGAALNLSGSVNNIGGTITLTTGNTLTTGGNVNNVGTINGASTIVGNLYNKNEGVISTGDAIGILNVTGNFRSNIGSKLKFKVAGNGTVGTATGYDRLAITGNAFLSDTVEIAWPSAAPINNTSYTILTATSISGTFSTLKLPANVMGTLTYNATNVVFNITGVVPTTLVSFTTQKQLNKVLCNWKTTNEINMLHFNVERSIDGVSFKPVGTLTSKNQTENAYLFTDDINGLSTKYIFYRLQMVDKDGKQAYSAIQRIRLEDKLGFSIYPNPAKNYIWINQNVSSLEVYNSIGKQVLSQNISSYNAPINISQLSKGLYIVKIKGMNGEFVVQKLVVE